MCGKQRTTFRDQFSPSIPRVLELELSHVVRLGGKGLYPLSQLASLGPSLLTSNFRICRKSACNSYHLKVLQPQQDFVEKSGNDFPFVSMFLRQLAMNSLCSWGRPWTQSSSLWLSGAGIISASRDAQLRDVLSDCEQHCFWCWECTLVGINFKYPRAHLWGTELNFAASRARWVMEMVPTHITE